MNDEQVKRYNEHAKFLADIAIQLLNDNKNVLNVNGVKEIICLYLLIPYITPDKLETPDTNCVIPDLKGNFCTNVSLKDLRDAICHSFVTVEAEKNDGSLHGKYLILDDRAMLNRKEHDALTSNSKTTCIDIKYANKKLLELFKEVVEFTKNTH